LTKRNNYYIWAPVNLPVRDTGGVTIRLDAGISAGSKF